MGMSKNLGRGTRDEAKVQSTPDNSNLQGEVRKVRFIEGKII